jgi:two-component system, OmpR family, phosphate regulon sensor histidine kinase PhoR
MLWAPGRRFPVLLAAATLIPIALLGWLGLRLLRQDRDLERQRGQERLKLAASGLALALERRLGTLEEQLAQGDGIRLTPAGLEPGAGAVLLYRGDPIPAADTTGPEFREAETLEFQRGDLAGAAAAYRRQVASFRPDIRASALVRLGRVLRRQSDRAGALAAYASLQTLGPVAVDGQPAEYLAAQGRSKVFEEAHDAAALREEVAGLARALYAGARPIDRATFDLYRDLVERWGGPPPALDSIARTETALSLWRAWRAGDLAPRGRRIIRVGAVPTLVVWAGGPARPAAWIATPAELEASLGPLWTGQHLAVSIYDTDGQAFLGPQRQGAVSLTPGETRFPFVLSVASGAGGDSPRGTALVGGLLLAFLLMLATAYGLYRAITRELELVRLQSDFVSAVSHEFRTPLTSMRHLIDMLVSRSVPNDERKAYYYELLARETGRLHRMVESLLSFGRMEAGAYAWRLEAEDVCQLARDTVEEFRREPLAREREVACETEEGVPPIRADREALVRALWNLLENAGKYSEPDAPIRVFARRRGGALLLGVEDRGAGIAPGEQAKIFQKFVRGAEARRAGTPGVGVGLALVKRIAEAHGGSVTLASEPGRGSTFTLVLPCPES